MTGTALAALILVSFATLGSTSLPAAAGGATGIVRQHFEHVVGVRRTRAEHDRVSGVLVNPSNELARSVRVQIDRSWWETSAPVVGLEQAGQGA